ncbi:MAG TPA: shikimate kinase [Candidatus Dormibacteraeota bacterium]|nr:shikimate kinase [Candidatus Dormibacteraeota bacterium]
MEPGWSDREEAVAAGIAALARSGMLNRPIALAGFMGVGKTTLGRRLAKVLDRPFYDTDRYVEETYGRCVDDFFAAGEESEFRRLEAEAVAELTRRGPVVIALGGGALLSRPSRLLLRERAFLVHLHVPWKELREHLAELAESRPLLRGRSTAEIHRLYLKRLATYRTAPLRITVDRRNPVEAATALLDALRALETGPGPAALTPLPRVDAALGTFAHLSPVPGWSPKGEGPSLPS